jgi:predicted lipoprotein with Yx(FWY)xxD motif
MKLLLIPAAVLAVAAVLAACGGSDNDSATAAPTGGSDETVSVQDIGDSGVVLVDSAGRALYTSDQEADGRVLCTEGCTSFWEPLTVSGDAPRASNSVPGRLAVVDRPDGDQQVTYDGMPLYTFTEEGPGEVTGDGFVDAFDGREFTWNVVAVGDSGSSSSGSDSSGSTPGGFSY